jgi:hypothetical protein
MATTTKTAPKFDLPKFDLPKVNFDAVLAMHKANVDTMLEAQGIWMQTAEAIAKLQYGWVEESVKNGQALLKGDVTKRKPEELMADAKAAADKVIAVAKGQRKAKAIKRLDILILDLDNGRDPREVAQIIARNNLTAIMWSTHSHGRDFTDIAESALHRHAGSTDVNFEDALDYLRSKHFPESLLSSAVSQGYRHEPAGVVYRVGGRFR